MIVFLTIFAYFLGAVPFGLLIAKSYGIDIRKKGSGNIGATNVLRVLGKRQGIFTLVLDALKGFVPASVFPLIGGFEPAYGVLFGAAAVLGHSFSLYLKFKGGKGVATGTGMLLGVAPVAATIGILCWGICMAFSRFVSLSSIIAAAAVVTTVWIRGNKGMVINSVLTLLAVLVVWLHRANIGRLLNGTEPRFEKKRRTFS